jgi:secreted trypsin-like serine protease
MNRLSAILASTLILGGSALAGEKQVRIVNGTEANAANYPWFATVMSNGGQCGGSLIHPRWVLSAAHCFEPGQAPSTVEVTIGRQKLSASATGQAIVAANIHIHPAYDSVSSDNDMALVELSADAVGAVVKLGAPATALTAGITARAVGRGGLAAPAGYLTDAYSLGTSCSDDLEGCIAEAQSLGKSDVQIVTTLLQANGLGDARQGVGYQALVEQSGLSSASPTVEQLVAAYAAAGSGVVGMAGIIIEAAGGSDELRQVDLPLVDSATCGSSTGYTITDNMLCAGYSGTPRDTCQGDSGGPLVIPSGQDWLQVGVVSFGGTCATNYGVYAKVANYLDWIEGYVPNFAYDRLFAWGESYAASLLRPTGAERSLTAAPYYARIYSASGMALGYNSQDQQLYFYDGAHWPPSSLGPVSDWLQQARDAGY